MWYVCDVLYAVLYVRVSCFVVRVCAVSRRYINVCNGDMFSVLGVYLDHLKFCVVCIDGVCEVVVVPYVDAVLAVTLMRVLLFVLHVCILRESV